MTTAPLTTTSTSTLAGASADSGRRRVVLSLARLEAGRMLRHPALPIGVLLTVLAAVDAGGAPWSGAAYHGYVAATAATLLAVSLATASAAARDARPSFEDAPTGVGSRVTAVMLGSLSLVAVVALLVVAAAAYLRASGGLDLGDEPGRTLHAHYSVPELVQPVVLAVLAAALGIAVGRRVRHRLGAGIVLFTFWFSTGAMYWLFNGPATIAAAVMQVQPMTVVAAPAATDPMTLPGDWLLSAPGAHQDYWGRVVVSPDMAAWHDVYVLALAAVAFAVALPGRWRRSLALCGVVVAVVAVLAQRAIQP